MKKYIKPEIVEVKLGEEIMFGALPLIMIVQNQIMHLKMAVQKRIILASIFGVMTKIKDVKSQL